MKTQNCVVIDYGIGNVFSVMRALEKSGATPRLTGDPAEILAADRVILPGVGAFGRASDCLRALGLDQIILEYVRNERPFMGICVGLQLLMENGTEFGNYAGLGLLRGSVEKISLQDANGQNLRIPLIGWFPVTANAAWDGTALQNSNSGDDFYFVHSYAARPSDPDNILATVAHGTDHIVAAVAKDNIVGLQFHPERSGAHGLRVLNTFLQL